MSNRQLRIIFVVIALLVLYTVAVRMNPPLLNTGGIRSNFNKEIEIDLLNEGVSSVSLRSVSVNGKNTGQAELKLKRVPTTWGLSATTVAYTYHSITEHKIKPLPDEEETVRALQEIGKTGETDTIFGYSLKVLHNNPVESVTIKYSYLGIPFTHTIDILPWS